MLMQREKRKRVKAVVQTSPRCLQFARFKDAGDDVVISLRQPLSIREALGGAEQGQEGRPIGSPTVERCAQDASSCESTFGCRVAALL